jgi:hypothetical protein
VGEVCLCLYGINLVTPHNVSLHERLLGFIGCLIGAAVCFFVAFLTLPLLALRPAKFALAFRHVQVRQIKSRVIDLNLPQVLGVYLSCSGVLPQPQYTAIVIWLTFSLRFSVLIGPINHAKHLLSKERLPFTLVYFGSLGLTLYFSLGVSRLLLSDRRAVLIYTVSQRHSYIGSLVCGIIQVSMRLGCLWRV